MSLEQVELNKQHSSNYMNYLFTEFMSPFISGQFVGIILYRVVVLDVKLLDAIN